MVAMACAVEWGVLSVDEAIAVAEYLGSYAGDDDKLSVAEAE